MTRFFLWLETPARNFLQNTRAAALLNEELFVQKSLVFSMLIRLTKNSLESLPCQADRTLFWTLWATSKF